MAQRAALPLRATNPAPRRNLHTTNCVYFLAGAFGGALFAWAFCFLFLSVAFGLLSPIVLLLDYLRHAPARRHRDAPPQLVTARYRIARAARDI